MAHQAIIQGFVSIILMLCLALGLAAMGYPGIVLRVPDLGSQQEGNSGGGSAGSSSVSSVASGAELGYVDETYSVFQYCRAGTCRYTTSKSVLCSETLSKLRVQGAFLSIHCASDVILFLIIFCGSRGKAVPGFKQLPHIMFAWVFISILVTWAVMVGSLHAKQCSNPKTWKQQGGQLGQAFPILVADFAFATLALIGYEVAMFFPDGFISGEAENNNHLWRKMGKLGRWVMRKNGSAVAKLDIGGEEGEEKSAKLEELSEHLDPNVAVASSAHFAQVQDSTSPNRDHEQHGEDPLGINGERSPKQVGFKGDEITAGDDEEEYSGSAPGTFTEAQIDSLV